ncbi:MAG: tetratricopeptide repeat protein [Elusimicrobia bacterium]|nr:tetratricopeptide repeat protein [Elusimicrobiota bacterium]
MKYILIIVLVVTGFKYGMKHFDLGDVYTWAKARPYHETRAKAIYYVGMVYYLQDKTDGSITAFNQLLADHPTCQYASKALFRLGNVQRSLNHFEEARSAYERYIEQFPNGPDIQAVQNNYEFVKFK